MIGTYPPRPTRTPAHVSWSRLTRRAESQLFRLKDSEAHRLGRSLSIVNTSVFLCRLCCRLGESEAVPECDSIYSLCVFFKAHAGAALRRMLLRRLVLYVCVTGGVRFLGVGAQGSNNPSFCDVVRYPRPLSLLSCRISNKVDSM